MNHELSDHIRTILVQHVDESHIGYNKAVAAITQVIEHMFYELQEHMKSVDWGYNGTWTDEIDDTMSDWIKDNI